jgi:hypothetical protein
MRIIFISPPPLTTYPPSGFGMRSGLGNKFQSDALHCTDMGAEYDRNRQNERWNVL